MCVEGRYILNFLYKEGIIDVEIYDRLLLY